MRSEHTANQHMSDTARLRAFRPEEVDDTVVMPVAERRARAREGRAMHIQAVIAGLACPPMMLRRQAE